MQCMNPKEANKRGNIATARIVPLLLVALLGYTSYVLTYQIGVAYLIDPSIATRAQAGVEPRVGTAAAILVIHYLLLLVTVVCFARLFGTIFREPGVVPRGRQYFVEKARRRASSRGSDGPDDTAGYTPKDVREPPAESRRRDSLPVFWHKDVFTSQYDGRPRYCSVCYNYKPDRAHHCSELGRCVLKMDHFCPWVGGIVSETSFKYFVQFTGWAALLCTHSLVVSAVFLAERQRHSRFVNAHWIILTAVAGLFGLFTAGMCGSSLQFCLVNSSTIENFTRKTKVWYLCVYLAPHVLQRYESSGRSDLRLISYPRPAGEEFETMRIAGAKVADADSVDGGAHESPLQTPPPVHHSGERPATGSTLTSPVLPPPTTATLRTFAILETQPGENPFDVGPGGNFREVMGHTLLDWLLPIHPSPLVDHSGATMYRMGDVVERLKREAGLVDRDAGGERLDGEKRRHHRQRRRRQRGHSSASKRHHRVEKTTEKEKHASASS